MDDDWGYPHFRKPPDGKFNVCSSEIHSMSIKKMVWCSRDGESTMAIENPISYFCFKTGTIKTINCFVFFPFSCLILERSCRDLSSTICSDIKGNLWNFITYYIYICVYYIRIVLWEIHGINFLDDDINCW